MSTAQAGNGCSRRLGPRSRARARYWLASLPLALALCLPLPCPPAGAQDLAQDVKQGFINAYVRRALQRGDRPEAARADANCLFDELQTRLTADDWLQLGQQIADGQKPQALRLLGPAIIACAHLGRPDPADDAAAPTDDLDSLRLARELRRRRVMEEADLRSAQGHAVQLPTGSCTAQVVTDAAGRAAGDVPIRCSDERLQPDMRAAVLAVMPLRAAGGATVQLLVTADDPEPGAGAGSAPGPDPAAANGLLAAGIDQRDSMAVRRELTQMRVQQMQDSLRSHLPVPAPLLGTCAATVHVDQTGAPATPVNTQCTDPRLQTPMQRAILALGALAAQPGATVQLRVSGVFPTL